jgi:NAD(P)-dependent dehydrogenase (short-subunit alcohol dehydrogenase family)
MNRLHNKTALITALGEADDIAYAVLYLASDEARHVTAAEIVIDGGASGTPGGAPIYRR